MDELLFAALARRAEQHLREFNVEDLASMAWAFGTVGMLVSFVMDPISVLDVMEAQGFTPIMSKSLPCL